MRELRRLYKSFGLLCSEAYRRLVGAFIALVMFTHLGQFAETVLGIGSAAVLDLLFLVLIAPLALLERRRVGEFVRTPYFLWIVLLCTVFAVNWARVVYGDRPLTNDEYIIETDTLQRLVLWPAVGFAVYVVPWRYFAWPMALVLLVVSGATIYDFFAPGALRPPGAVPSARAQGVYFNPNTTAEAILVAAVLSLRLFRGRMATVLLVLVGAAVLLTFSRSGVAALVLLCGYLAMRGRLTRGFAALPVVLVLSYSTILVNAEDVLVSLGYDASVANVMGRLSFIGSADVGSLTDSSSESRAEVAVDTFSAALARPVTGHGFDAIAEFGMNPHNQLLALWYKFGLGGLLVWFGMVAVLFKRGLDDGLGLVSPMLVVFAFVSMFSHNILEMRLWLVGLSVAALVPARRWHGPVAGGALERLGALVRSALVRGAPGRRASARRSAPGAARRPEPPARPDASSGRPASGRRRRRRTAYRF